MSKTISILGCGWLGFSLGAFLVKEGYVVKGSTMREEKLAAIDTAGMQGFQLKVGAQLEGVAVEEFFRSDVLILNIPPGRRQPDVEKRFPEQVRMIVEEAIRGGVKQLLLVSSTSVYAANNRVVTEEEALAPETASGRALVVAEEYVRGVTMLSTTVLRLAGLVGGERHPGRWFAGKAGLGGGEVPVNLVHREDVIAAIAAVLVQEKWGEVYQLCADEHPLKKDYYPLMARRLGLAEPVFSGPPVLPYKVVGNEKIKRELGLVLRYPDPMQFP